MRALHAIAQASIRQQAGTELDVSGTSWEARQKNGNTEKVEKPQPKW